MPLAILVIDRHSAVQGLCQFRWIEGFVDSERKQGFGLVEQKAAIAIGAGNKRFSGVCGQREVFPFQFFSAFQ